MERTGNQYVKQTQKDYSYAFKLQVVTEVENGELNIEQTETNQNSQSFYIKKT